MAFHFLLREYSGREEQIEVTITTSGPLIEISYSFSQVIARKMLPTPLLENSFWVLSREISSFRTSKLWEENCFELFFQRNSRDGYYELNFSPFKKFNFYFLSSYRANLREEELERLSCKITIAKRVSLDFKVLFPLQMEFSNLYPCVVLKLKEGTFYYAISHPPHGPDFHGPFASGFSVFNDN